MRLAWFSPIPPVRSGIATYSAMVLPHLAVSHEIDVFADTDARAVRLPAERGADGYLSVRWAGCTVRQAHDFVPLHGRRPYDLVVYQLGNARCHDYQWPYLLRFPGLVVLHDAQVHQSRAAALLEQGRKADYRAELAFSHPAAPAAVAEWVISGLGGNAASGLYPLTGVVLESARAVAVHHPRLAASLQDDHPGVLIRTIRHGAPDLVERGLKPTNASVCFAAFGLITPEKRIPQILRALAAIRPVAPYARLRLVGAVAPHYDLAADVERFGLGDAVETTGYVDDGDFDRYVREADVCLCLRWPTNREASGPWYRCLAAGKPTIINDLTHLADVATLDPRSWSVLMATESAALATAPLRAEQAAAVSIDILDEDHSLALAMRRLALDAALRDSLGRAARRLWTSNHTLEHMIADYERTLSESSDAPPRPVVEGLPAHVRADATNTLRRLAAEVGVAVDLLG